MQLVAESVFGLCDNLKPNRFNRTERKRFCGALHMQSPLFLPKVDFLMNILIQSAIAWKELTEYRYQFLYGYKKTLYTINLSFSYEDYPHLAGFQYLKDIVLPNYTSAQIVNRIIENKITFEQIQKSNRYEEMVKPRLKALIHLKDSLDNDFILYSFMPQMYPFIANIKANYLIASHFNIDSFIFIIRTSPNGNSKCDFLCCSAFTKGERDYETNQKKRSLLKKERIHIPTNTSTTLIDKLISQN